jgi:NAD(P)-dependent dehydrogenase (short-subunit alcohol dehydrogenase family)
MPTLQAAVAMVLVVPIGVPVSNPRTVSVTAGEPQSEAAPGTEGLIPRHQPSYEEVADIAAFLASDSARTMTGSEINLTGGAVID